MRRGPAALHVVGDPIAHSLSPAIHLAAYAHLGLPWHYSPRRVARGSLRETVAALRASEPGFLGLSVTMPLKPEALAIADEAAPCAIATGAANTLVVRGSGLFAENTDVDGIVRACAALRRPERLGIIGAGSTAVSAVHAAARLGAVSVEIRARDRTAAERLAARAETLGLLANASHLDGELLAEAVINTLPAGVRSGLRVRPAAAGSWLLTVGYGAKTSAQERAWRAEGGQLVSGIEMLLEQALLQVRLFAVGSVGSALPDEAAVFAAMRAAAVSAGPDSVERS